MKKAPQILVCGASFIFGCKHKLRFSISKEFYNFHDEED